MHLMRVIGFGLAAVTLALAAGAQPAATKPATNPAAAVDPAAAPTAQWVWSPRQTGAQSVYLRKTFDCPAGGAKSAFVWGSCDNELTIFVNGRAVANSTEWAEPVKADVTRDIVAGRNVIAILGKNHGGSAAAIAKLSVVTRDGARIDIATDKDWRFAEQAAAGWNQKDFDDAAWKPVKVAGPFGMGPWGDLSKEGRTTGGPRPGLATTVESLTLLPGFKAELLYSVPKDTQDSWVSMTPDPKGRLIVSGEKGTLFRVTPGRDAASTKVEPIDAPIGFAQGLLYAFDSLYVVVNGGGVAGNNSGLYRLRSTDGGDTFGKVERLGKINGGGEHGPHAVVLGPDKMLYVVAGNFTKFPGPATPDSPHRNFAEDQLLPRNPDGGGHDPNVMAPGGWIARTDPDGRQWTFFAAGLRNTYDIAFNAAGELFGYDSDMEWDTGTPWYRPTRVNLLVSGGEYGWRNGTGKWPDYYPDSLGAVVNTGLSSPVGVTFGYGAKFPTKYQQAFFVADWAYGKLYAVHMAPDGAGYKGTFETFAAGRAWNLTDVVIGGDGAMYATIGGRGTQSGLYRISYAGAEPTTPATNPAADDAKAAAARAVRHKLESFHGKADPAAVDFLWPYLNSGDRHLRYAARVALEWQPLSQWQDRALAERRPTAAIHALIALIRTGDKSLQTRVLDALNQLPLKALSHEQTLELCRAYGLCFIRMGQPEAAAAKQVAARFEATFPTQSAVVNREVVLLLAYLDSPVVAERAMKLQQASRTQEEQLHYVLALRVVKSGWTPELRRAYFMWINVAQQSYKGGASFKNFLARIRQDAVKTLAPDEAVALEKILANPPLTPTAASTLKPRQFVKNWQMHDLLPVIDQATAGRNFLRGKEAFEAVQCAQCHRFGSDGGSTGPDLTGVGNRFAPTDVLEAILVPSKVISDQYETTEVATNDGDMTVGRIESEDDQQIVVRTNPLAPDVVTIKKKNVEFRRISKTSMMPEGSVDILSRDEVLDLIAYIRSAGNADDKSFKK